MFKWKKEVKDLLGKVSDAILKLRTKDACLEGRVKIAEEQIHQLSKALDVEIGRLNNKVEARLIQFHKEITDKSELKNLLKILKVEDKPETMLKARLQKHLGDSFVFLELKQPYYHPVSAYPKHCVITGEGILVPIGDEDAAKIF